MTEYRNRKKLWIVLACIIVLLAAIIAVCIAIADKGHEENVSGDITSISKTYNAENVDSYLTSGPKVTVSADNKKGIIFFDGPGTERALIFYPGAKVEYTAYSPLLYKLAEQGMDGFLIKMPLDYAFLNSKKANSIIKNFDYSSWNLAGHSLGGAMIANYAHGTDYDIDGLYLLAAYATSNVKDVEDVLVIYGSEDGVLSKSKVEKGRKYLPDGYREVVIQGGNHAQFGSYGTQDGDGTATISAEEQLQQTVNAIMEGWE